MKYYVRRKGDKFPSEISKAKFYSLVRSKKWSQRVWTQSDEIVGRELIEQD